MKLERDRAFTALVKSWTEKAISIGSAVGTQAKKFERWTAQRKTAIILEVLKGKSSVPEAVRKYGFTQSEFREWTE